MSDYQRPHRANQPAWEAIKELHLKHGEVRLDHFHLLRRLGCGDIGSVFLCEIKEGSRSKCNNNNNNNHNNKLYALKVVDREYLKVKNKVKRAEMEKQVLSVLDHPFLPTLYANFDAYQYSCLLIDYCHGGDLFKLQQHQPNLRFSTSTAKFYAAEVLVALEYLHMMGIIYRDLKPENVLIQEDGHVMLSDFDLSLHTQSHPKLLIKKSHTTTTKNNPILCCEKPTVNHHDVINMKKKKNKKTNSKHAMMADVELSAEPMSVKSTSFVGTHEYLAPEVILGLGHGSAVDWWAYGVLLYELLYGITPFKDEDNEKTMRNIVGKGKSSIRFPRSDGGDDNANREEMAKAQDLIRKLLVRNPKKRTGYTRGSCEIKRHEFFHGINWALIRSVKPPIVPRDDDNFNISFLSSVKQKSTIHHHNTNQFHFF